MSQGQRVQGGRLRVLFGRRSIPSEYYFTSELLTTGPKGRKSIFETTRASHLIRALRGVTPRLTWLRRCVTLSDLAH